MVDITAAELRAAEKIFGDRLELAKRYVGDGARPDWPA
jgi:16S rRNA (guanine527-N7)-methyltransferase